MGRYKLGPQGTYFDPNDSGPDQASADQISQFQQQQAPAAPSGGYQPPTGGINPGPIGTPQPSPLPNLPGQPGWDGGWSGDMRGQKMPQIQPNPEFEKYYADRRASGLTFPQIMDEWQAQHPQPVNVLGGMIGGGQAQPASGGIFSAIGNQAMSAAQSAPKSGGGGFFGTLGLGLKGLM